MLRKRRGQELRLTEKVPRCWIYRHQATSGFVTARPAPGSCHLSLAQLWLQSVGLHHPERQSPDGPRPSHWMCLLLLSFTFGSI